MGEDISLTKFGALQSTTAANTKQIEELYRKIEGIQDSIKGIQVETSAQTSVLASIQDSLKIVRADRIHDKIVIYSLLAIVGIVTISHIGAKELINLLTFLK